MINPGRWGACCFLLLSGCAMYRPDPVTQEQIARTVDYEVSTYNYVLNCLEDGVWSRDEELGLQVRHDSEMARLSAWRSAEAAKDAR